MPPAFTGFKRAKTQVRRGSALGEAIKEEQGVEGPILDTLRVRRLGVASMVRLSEATHIQASGPYANMMRRQDEHRSPSACAPVNNPACPTISPSPTAAANLFPKVAPPGIQRNGSSSEPYRQPRSATPPQIGHVADSCSIIWLLPLYVDTVALLWSLDRVGL
jgi:hypothetical protein